MNKLTAFLLALVMLVGVSTAFAATPSAEDVGFIDTIGEGETEIVWTDDANTGDDGESPVAEAVEAQQNGSALDVLPQEIRDLLPAGYTAVNEIRSMKLQGNLNALDRMEELKAVIKFDTPYAEGEIVYLAVGIPGEAGTEWVLLKGLGNKDRNVEVAFDHDTLVKIGEKSFAVMVISKA